MEKNLLLFQLILLIFLFNVHVIAEYTDIVKTDKGRVRGNVLRTVQLKQQYSAFKGIPYAQPPIGYRRRFRRPEPAKPWNKILDATEDPNICTQWDFAWRARDRHIGSEDCLYLNVYTPELNFTNPRPRAVMAYIHGGAFLFGSIHSSKLGPDFLIEKDVVVVAMNYRLGMFGFLSFPSPIVTANNGLRDQVEALRWIQRNIRKFGGDPDKVTIFGESAGAASVEYHKISKQSQDLFRASISMSGAALNDWAYYDREYSTQQGFRIIKDFIPDGWSTDYDLYEKMLKWDVHDILLYEYLEWLFYSKIPYRPTQDYYCEDGFCADYFLTDSPSNIYKSKNFTAKPHILGFMQDEGITIAAPFSTLTDMVCSSIASMISGVVTDFYFMEGIDLTQRVLTLSNDQPIYYYKNSFDYDRALHKVGAMKSKSGAGHGDDVAHIFWVSNQEQSLDLDSDIGKHRQKMVTMWTNFAKYLKPIPDDKYDPVLGHTKWEKSNQAGGYLDINRDLVFHANSRPIKGFIETQNQRSMRSF